MLFPADTCTSLRPPWTGFYLNATREPYSKNFRMYDYITKELPDVLRSLQELDMERVRVPSFQLCLSAAKSTPACSRSPLQGW